MLTFVFGETSASVRAVPGGLRVGVPCPVLSGGPGEVFPVGAGLTETSGEWTVMRAPNMSVFAVVATMDDDSVEAVTTRLYRGLFERTRGLHLYRVWHFIPGLLNRNDGREETYRRFCAARGAVFDDIFPSGAEVRMPAATVVGAEGDRLVLVALAGEAVPEHFENPDQTPGYRYPERYGARPPSFARATRVATAGGVWTFVSGTAAIRGSDSLHPGDAPSQAAVMDANVATMLRIAAPEAPAGFASRRTYLKPGVTAPDGVSSCETMLIRADICRGELLIESEITMHSPLTSHL